MARPNLMVKVPATSAGVPAIRQLIGRGLNINITLLFSVEVYAQVVEAYMSGLEDFAPVRRRCRQIGSVASIFVSRIDAAIDKRLDQLADPRLADRLRGKAANRQCETCLSSLSRVVFRPTLAASGRSGRKNAAPALGLDQHQKPRFKDTMYIEALSRQRHCGHDPAGDHG